MSTAVLSSPDKAAVPRPRPWTLATRIAFRFACLYLTLYCLPGGDRSSLVDAIPKIDEWITEKFWAPWKALCPWVAIHVFQLSGPRTQYHPTGSGDTTLDYVQVFCFAAIAAVGTLVWSVLDRRRTEYRTLYAWLRLLVRYTLAMTLLSYAFVKLYPLQFGSPSLTVLVETYGESSPMRLLWTFMGLSRPYAFFAGTGELVAGLLLLFRRTALIGALVAIGVMANVVALNFCFDVPVKLYSSHLLAMAVFLLLPDIRALWSFFVLHRPVVPEGLWVPSFQQRWQRVGAIALQVSFIASVLLMNMTNAHRNLKEYSVELVNSPLHGLWIVDRFQGAASQDGAAQWERVVLDTRFYSSVYLTDGNVIRFGTEYDSDGRRIRLKSRRTADVAELTFSQPDREHILFEGDVNGGKAQIAMHRIPTDRFLLTTRGFHWINEDPFNR